MTCVDVSPYTLIYSVILKAGRVEVAYRLASEAPLSLVT